MITSDTKDWVKEYAALPDKEAKKAYLENQRTRIEQLTPNERQAELTAIYQRVAEIERMILVSKSA